MRLLTAISFDPENPKDAELADKLVNEIKKDLSVDEIKEMVKKESVNIWNSKDVVMEMLAKQNGITHTTIC